MLAQYGGRAAEADETGMMPMIEASFDSAATLSF